MLARLTDSLQIQVGDQTIQNAYLGFTGDLFSLPGGAAKLAVGGGVHRLQARTGHHATATTPGRLRLARPSLNIPYDRDVKSAYAELYLPFIGADQGIPFVHKLELNLSARYDDYSDFGDTTNPKIAINWAPFEGLTLRGNYAEAFVAPALTSRGSNDVGPDGRVGVRGRLRPGPARRRAVHRHREFPRRHRHSRLPAGLNDLFAEQCHGPADHGRQRQPAAADGQELEHRPGFRASSWQNFTASITLLEQRAARRHHGAGAIAGAGFGRPFLPDPVLSRPARRRRRSPRREPGLPQTGALNATTYFIYNYQQRNVLNLDVAGIDFSLPMSLPTSIGNFRVNAAYTHKTKFDQFFGETGQKFSVLGTAGFNTTFPSVEDEGRLNLGYEAGGLNANLFFNYLGSYRNWSGFDTCSAGARERLPDRWWRPG